MGDKSLQQVFSCLSGQGRPDVSVVSAKGLPFRKMHGLGNDFVIFDRRRWQGDISDRLVTALADRHCGIGFDQLILIDEPSRADADIRIGFYNADGSVSGTCGNGTRCVASYLLEETERRSIRIETGGGLLQAELEPAGGVTVDMGPPRLEWQEIPMAEARDTLLVDLGPEIASSLGLATCTGMGNPHATFFVTDAEAVDLSVLGPLIEHHALFPERVNVGIASLIEPDHLRLRVWERGAGETLACGSGACAAFVAAVRRGLCAGRGTLRLALGELQVAWIPGGTVRLTGPVATSFTGEISPELLGLL